jgi:RHS repeat-associated protein
MLSYRKTTDNGSTWSDYYFLQDEQGSVVRLLDNQGGCVERLEYDPYGKATYYAGTGSSASYASGVGDPWTYAGGRLDSETGLLYLRNRYLQVEFGRFCTIDPASLYDTDNEGNAYSYVGNRSTETTDPYGLFAVDTAESYPHAFLAGPNTNDEASMSDGVQGVGKLNVSDMQRIARGSGTRNMAICGCARPSKDGQESPYWMFGDRDAEIVAVRGHAEEMWCIMHCIWHAGLTWAGGPNTSIMASLYWELIEHFLFRGSFTKACALCPKEHAADIFICDRLGDICAGLGPKSFIVSIGCCLLLGKVGYWLP